MATLNLRGTLNTGTTLTFAQVDANFTNLNKELLWGSSGSPGIALTSGVLTFTPNGSTGAENDPYPPIEIDLDANYLNQVEPLTLATLNHIAGMPDDRVTSRPYLVDASIDSTGFVSPDDKLLISDQGRLLYNSPSIGVEGVLFESVSANGGNGDTGSWLAHPNFIDEQFLTDYFQYNSATGTITIDSSTNGGLLNRYDEVAGINRRYAAGYAGFIAQMNHMQGSQGVVLALYTNDGFTTAYRRRITGVQYTKSGGENTSVTLQTSASPAGNLGSPSGNNITAIQVVDAGSGNSLKLLKSPRAPLTPPITPPTQYYTKPFAQVMIPSVSRRVDQADLALSYGDETRLVCQGLASKGNMVIRPVVTDTLSMSSSSTLLGAQMPSEQNGIVGGKSLELYGGDIANSSMNVDAQQGGDLTLGGGVNTYSTQSGAVSPANDFVLNNRDQLENYSALTDFSDSPRPLIKLFGLQSYNPAKQNSIVISAGRNYRTNTSNDGANRVGGDIRFLLGTGSGQGAPGNLVIEAYDVPTASTTLSNGQNKPNNSADLTPFKIEWDSTNYNYKTTISNLNAKIAHSGAFFTDAAETANNPLDVNGSGDFAGADGTGILNSSTGGAFIDQEHLDTATIIKSSNLTYDDTGNYSSTYDYTGAGGSITAITSRLAMFSGSSQDAMSNAASRVGGDTIFLGNFAETSNGNGKFNSGLSIDGEDIVIKGDSFTVYDPDVTSIARFNYNSKTQILQDLEVTGEITASGDITAFSDESIKENVEVIEDAVDKVQQLNGYTFDRTDVETSRQTGVIAQEVLKVLPEAVGEKDGIHTVAYGNMVGLLIEAIKEQQGQIDSLKEELQSIKSINK